MKKFKPMSKEETECYVINCDEYLSFVKQMTSEKKIVIKVSPTFVAGWTSDDFVIDVRKRRN